MDADAEVWLNANYGLLAHATCSVLGPGPDAEDATQIAALRVVLKWKVFRYGGVDGRRAWAHTVAVRCALDIRRALRTRYGESMMGQQLVEGAMHGAPDVADTVLDREAIRAYIAGPDQQWRKRL